MIFVFRKWRVFCKTLTDKGITSIPANALSYGQKSFLVLKHDVETNVKKAYIIAKIEKEQGHCGSYYVQAYLLKNKNNVTMLQDMQKMGHEISYHYDVMDSSKGDIDKAKEEFAKNKTLFEENGFKITTVCQHGNPLVERVGYTSNRDFFRNDSVRKQYPDIADIMVNFKGSKDLDYSYYSDAGRVFKLIFDPLFNDVVNSDDKNVPYRNLCELNKEIDPDGCYIVSTHPHRWCSSVLMYGIKTAVFLSLKTIAKALYKIPFLKKFMSKYYYLAKKI